MARQAPGTWQTHIVVWDVDDPSKAGDPAWFWSAEDVGALMRTAQPEDAGRLVMAGRPKGNSLASLRERHGGDEVELHAGLLPDERPADMPAERWALLSSRPGHTARFSLAPWRDADPRTTRFIISHCWQPKDDELAVNSGLGDQPPELVEARKQWLAAIRAGDPSAGELRKQVDALMEEAGIHNFAGSGTWNEKRASELAPGVFVLDERPGR